MKIGTLLMILTLCFTHVSIGQSKIDTEEIKSLIKSLAQELIRKVVK